MGPYLEKATGYSFPVLGRITHGRAIRGMATMVRDNLDAQTTQIGLEAKSLVGVVYATLAQDLSLKRDMRKLAAHHRVPDAVVDAVASFAANTGDLPSLDPKTALALHLARAVTPNPAVTDEALVERLRPLAPAAIVETVVWVSVLQMLKRLGAYYTAA